ncbi:Granulin -like protein [Echinococcus granulosus]|nr:Granulin -like protein [Echinococcus granulosus]
MAFVPVWFVILLSGLALAEDQCSLLCASGVCCNGANGYLQCCPASDGICCESGTSCCPRGTVCDSDGYCTRIQSGFFAFMNFFAPPPPLSQIPTENPPTTPATKTEASFESCPATCGDLCCPFEGGVCCNDGEHCCPPGYECDILTKSCRLSPKDELSSISDSRVCPLVDSGCRNTDTCCVMFDGTMGCCPYEEADCCADGYHCCPRGTHCTSDSDGCVPRSGAWVNPFEPSNYLIGRKRVKCSDGKSACHKGSTCCKTVGSGAPFACCPFENAVCCNDGEHCCPQGYLCDSRNGGFCVSLSTIPIIPVVSGEASKHPVEETVMCDDSSYCEGPNATCCQLADDSWGCCPFLDAVCCKDRKHCCPSSYECDTTYNACVRSDDASSTIRASSEILPALTSKYLGACFPKATPCSGNGKTGCCPLENAVCCSDGLHCCPKDSVCTASGWCLMEGDKSLTDGFLRAPRLLPRIFEAVDIARCPLHTSAEPNVALFRHSIVYNISALLLLWRQNRLIRLTSSAIICVSFVRICHSFFVCFVFGLH